MKNNDIKCKECKRVLWENKGYLKAEYKPVYDINFLRIFKDDEDINNNKMFLFDNEINHSTIDNFKEKFVKKYFEKEKGITQADEEHLKKTNKIIRELSQVSYRLLNFILYSHLFLAKIYTDNKKFDAFLPRNTTWMDILTTCWKLLENE